MVAMRLAALVLVVLVAEHAQEPPKRPGVLGCASWIEVRADGFRAGELVIASAPSGSTAQDVECVDPVCITGWNTPHYSTSGRKEAWRVAEALDVSHEPVLKGSILERYRDLNADPR